MIPGNPAVPEITVEEREQGIIHALNEYARLLREQPKSRERLKYLFNAEMHLDYLREHDVELPVLRRRYESYRNSDPIILRALFDLDL